MNDIVPGAYSIRKIYNDGYLFDGWYEDRQNIKLNSTSIFPVIRYFSCNKQLQIKYKSGVVLVICDTQISLLIQ